MAQSSAVFLKARTKRRDRTDAQELAWNWVWLRRLVYFAALISSGYLALFPLIFKSGLEGACASEYFCPLASLIGAAKSFMPGFAALWIDTFRANPGWFLPSAAALVACLLAGAWLNRKIRDTMRLIWSPPTGKARPSFGFISRFIYRLRNCWAYQWSFRRLTRDVLPFLFAIAIYYLGAVLASRLTFSIVSAAGGVCAESTPAKPINASVQPFNFKSSDPCAASGYMLQEGARYKIWIEVGKNWADSKINTDVEGFSEAKLYWAVPSRRWLAQPWFKPIARIGAHGNDEYPLEPLVPFATGETKKVLATEIRARRDGELFLYVNDAVLFYSSPWYGFEEGYFGIRCEFYSNNKGTATVRIQRVEAPPIPEKNKSDATAKASREADGPLQSR